MKDIFKGIIQRGGYDLTALLQKIDGYHIEGRMTDAERDELYALARASAKAQYDYAAEIEKIWEAIRELRSNATDTQEWVEFVQPTGAHDAYQPGAKVIFNGDRYICNIANCVWSPAVYPDAWMRSL